jgi:hypothetical protein
VKPFWEKKNEIEFDFAMLQCGTVFAEVLGQHF